jgi:hypothetical protein
MKTQIRIVTVLVILYLVYNYQKNILIIFKKITNKTQNIQNNSTKSQNNNTDININHFDLINDKTVILPVTSHGFHDHFAAKNNFSNNKLLGWRYWYLKNKSNYLVKPTGNFDNIPTRQYLDRQENTQNWFYDLYSSEAPDDNIIE